MQFVDQKAKSGGKEHKKSRTKCPADVYPGCMRLRAMIPLPHHALHTMGERRELNPRPPEPQSGALPTELRPPYVPSMKHGHSAPGGSRTPDPLLRRQLLCPAELRARDKWMYPRDAVHQEETIFSPLVIDQDKCVRSPFHAERISSGNDEIDGFGDRIHDCPLLSRLSACLFAPRIPLAGSGSLYRFE